MSGLHIFLVFFITYQVIGLVLALVDLWLSRRVLRRLVEKHGHPNWFFSYDRRVYYRFGGAVYLWLRWKFEERGKS